MKRAIQSSLEEAEAGARYSNFGFDDDTPPEVENAILSDRSLGATYDYAASYFLAKAHGDPDHSGTPWPVALSRLVSDLERLS